MRKIDTYILEKLRINKNIEIKPVPEGLPEINTRVLVVRTGKKTSRESYVVYDVYEILDYEDNYKTLILRTIDGEKVDLKFDILSKEEKERIQQPRIIHKYFAEVRKVNYSFIRVFDIPSGNELLNYGIINLNRKLRYIYSGFLLDCKGNKVDYLRKLKRILNG